MRPTLAIEQPHQMELARLARGCADGLVANALHAFRQTRMTGTTQIDINAQILVTAIEKAFALGSNGEVDLSSRVQHALNELLHRSAQYFLIVLQDAFAAAKDGKLKLDISIITTTVERAYEIGRDARPATDA